ncbi:twin-arginine translocation signal domain-containing protein [Candidatus Microgenomates bacterium]|nr:twin-arginine translocation signal domain-containing protein [Candidatus Microgenomates bacterium]
MEREISRRNFLKKLVLGTLGAAGVAGGVGAALSRLNKSIPASVQAEPSTPEPIYTNTPEPTSTSTSTSTPSPEPTVSPDKLKFEPYGVYVGKVQNEGKDEGDMLVGIIPDSNKLFFIVFDPYPSDSAGGRLFNSQILGDHNQNNLTIDYGTYRHIEGQVVNNNSIIGTLTAKEGSYGPPTAPIRVPGVTRQFTLRLNGVGKDTLISSYLNILNKSLGGNVSVSRETGQKNLEGICKCSLP